MAHGRAVTTVTIGCLLSGLVGSALMIGGSASAGRAPRLDAIATAEKDLRARTDGRVTIRRDRTGKVHFVGTQAGHSVRRPDGMASGTSPGVAARAHIAKYGALFGIEDAGAELAVLHTSSAGPLTVVHLAQRAGGVPVLGGELAVTLDSADNLVSINGETGAPATTRDAVRAGTGGGEDRDRRDREVFGQVGDVPAGHRPSTVDLRPAANRRARPQRCPAGLAAPGRSHERGGAALDRARGREVRHGRPCLRGP